MAKKEFEMGIEPNVALWNHVADFLDADSHTSTRRIINDAATLMHIAAVTWHGVVPPATAPPDLLSEEAFVDLAKKMWKAARARSQV
jgi:hypothetical protein